MLVPLATLWPAAGSVRVTWSLGTSWLSSTEAAGETLNPAFSRALRASCWVMPLTSGMAVSLGPEENQTVTVEPLGAMLPPLGLCLVKVPLGSTESLSSFSW